jgi:alpha-L-rhamnosidase
MKINNCRLNHMKNPLGFTLESSRVSWTVEESQGKKQDWAQITVSKDVDFASVIYDSGKDKKASSLAFPLSFALEPYTRYYWKVKVQADNGDVSESEVNWFETAKLQDDWQADWISCDNIDTQNPIFFTEIDIEEAIDNTRIYTCGLGLYELYVNGKKIGNEYLTPGCNDYAKWLQYQTYEVNLQKGKNIILMSLGNGWYKGRFGFHGVSEVYGNAFKCILEVRKNGHLLCKTDSSWLVRKGNILFNNIYDGEIIDATITDNSAVSVHVLHDSKESLMARLSLPVVVKEELPVKEVIHTPAGETVIDMGQNFAGFMRFNCYEPKGTKVKLQYGEVLQEGNFYRDNLRTAKAEYSYISDGKPRVLEPHFTYYGFRYVKVEGLNGKLNPNDFTGCVLYSDLEMTGNITTGNKKVNQLISNIVWSHKSNYIDTATDCPQRDERMGWTGDTQMFSGTACFNMNSYAFLNKFLYDTYMSQRELGYVPHTVPAFDNHEPTTAAWGDVATIVPWTLYTFYGDKNILEQQYESMRLWVDYIYKADIDKGGKRLWEPEFAFADWLAQDNEDPNERYLGATDITYVSSAYYYYSANIVAKAAKVIGKDKDAAYYNNLAKEVKAAIQREFFTESGRLAISTQTGYVLALFMDFAPEHARKNLVKELKRKLNSNHGYLKTGFVGTPYINRVLSENGLNNMAYRLLLNEKNPSWLYAVVNGATTVWERWNSMLENGRVNGTDMTSFNHYAYGSVLEWIYRNMAGLQPVEDEPGFKKAVIAPQPYRWIHKVDAVYKSAAGTYESHWEEKDECFIMKIVIPFDATAKVIFPYGDKKEETLEAGTYEYSLDMSVGKAEYNIDCPIIDMTEDESAIAVIDQYMPNWHGLPWIMKESTPRQLKKETTFGLNICEKIEEFDRKLRAI